VDEFEGEQLFHSDRLAYCLSGTFKVNI